jgi:hypothetical protein
MDCAGKVVVMVLGNFSGAGGGMVMAGWATMAARLALL